MYEKFMKRALLLAKKSFDDGEVPVGAVIIRNNEIIAVGRNKREKLKNSLCHAEIEAINNACKAVGDWRLTDCEMVVTLEPCPMCAGAIINSRISKVVYGARDERAGSVSSVISMFDLPYNFHPKVKSGVLEKECKEILQLFFQKIRLN